ncbi:MAG: nucleotidyltransferase family protein [Anaerolineae bacterium]
MASIRHLINCISSSPTLEGLPTLSDDDWEDITVTAIVLGLAPLLHWRLEQGGLQPPAMCLARLAVTRQAQAKRNEAIAGQLQEILAACAGEGIDVIVLKGALLAPAIYPEPALRPMNDIDLLFRPRDLARAGLILETLGYEGKHKSAEQGPGITKHTSTYRRLDRNGAGGATPNPYLSAGGDRTVEPHRSLEESWFGLKVDITPGVWQRAVPVSLHGQPAYRLSSADLLLHLAVHAAFHFIMGAAIFLQLYDLHRVLITWANEVRWPEFLERAAAARAQPFAFAGLHWARTLYRAPVPPGPMAELEAACAPALAANIRAMDVERIFRRTQQPPLVTLRQRLWRGLADRWETARWAASPGGKWQVWQTALALHKTDTMALLRARLGKPG